MAGNTTIGKLNVVISGQAEGFEKAIGRAEKSVAGFAKKLTAPIGGLTAGIAGIGGLGALAAGGIFNPIAGLAKLLPGGGLAAQAAGLADVSEGFDRTLERYQQFHEATQKFGVSGGFFRSFQLALGPDADKAEKLLTKFNKYLTTNPEITRGAKTREEALLKVRDAINAMENPLEKSDLAFKAFGKTGLEALGALEPGKLEEKAKIVQEMGLYDPRVAGGAKEMRALMKELKLMKEANDALSFVFEKPMKQAEILYQKGGLGNTLQALSLAMESGMRRFDSMVGAVSKEGLLNMAGKPLKAGDIGEMSEANRAKFDEAIGKIQEMGKAGIDVYDQARELARSINATDEQMQNLEKVIGAAKERASLLFTEAYAKQLTVKEIIRDMPPWQAALYGQEGFRKASEKDQFQMQRMGALSAVGEINFANRGTFKTLESAFRNIPGQAERGPGHQAEAAKLGMQFLGNATRGGTAPLALQGSQEEAAMIDSIRQGVQTSEWLPTVEEFRAGIREARANDQAKAIRDAAIASALENALRLEGANVVPPG